MILSILITSVASLQVIVFHGLGDQCSNGGMKKFTKQINGDCIEIGNGGLTSVTMDFKEQAKEACDRVIEKYSGQQLIAVGLSQGALIARYIATDCEFDGTVTKLLSIGGPQYGVSTMPHCPHGIICAPINAIIRGLVYSNAIQHHIGPAGYFRNHKDLHGYLESCDFLPDLNNERNFSQTRKNRFQALQGLMLIKFTSDTMIYPIETSHFEGYNEEGQIVPLQESSFYQNDLIGLRSLVEGGRAQFIEIDGDHLQFSQSDITNIFIPFLQ